jgi:hypothetical protein
METDVLHLVKLDRAAKKALAASPGIADKLKDENLSVEQMPQEWFRVGEVHLHSRTEGDLVVIGTDGFLGVNIDPFWILRKNPTGYDLVLDTVALGVRILEAKTNGLRDIEAGAMIGVAYVGTNHFKFDGHGYQLAEQSSQLVDASLPANLWGYEAHKPWTQKPGQDPAPILAEAREWIWRQLKAQKRSQVKVSTHADDGSESTRQFVVDQSEMGEWRILVKEHRIVWDGDPPPGARRKVIQDNLSIAVKVQRIAPGAKDSETAKVFSDDDTVPASSYRLLFVDELGKEIAVL